MKRVKYIVPFIMLIIALLGTENTKAQEYFQTISIDTVNVSFDAKCQCNFRTNDGGYLITCQVDEWNPKLNEYSRSCERIIKYDINGNRLWYKDFYDVRICGICELKDESIIVCGNKLLGTPEEFKYAYIIKLNPCGEVEWAKEDMAANYEGESNLFTLRTVIDTGDGLVFPFRFTASFYDPDNTPSFTYDMRTDLLKLDYDGKIVYRTRFEQYGFNQEIWGGAVDSMGNIWMSGSCSAPDPYSPDFYLGSPLIVKCDADGDLLYIKSAKDEEIDFYTDSYPFKNSLMSKDDTFFVIPPLTLIVTGPGNNDFYISSGIMEVDKECNLTTHIIKNTDYDPEYTNWMFGLDFIDGQEHLITSSRYVSKDAVKNIRIGKIGNMLDNSQSIVDGGRRFIMDGTLRERLRDGKSIEDDDIVETNRICITDKNGKMVDSLDMGGIFTLKERVTDVFTVENNNFLVVSTELNTYDYITRIRKFNRDFEPALIDNTVREYDRNCDHSIKSGIVRPVYERLVSVNDIASEIKQLRLSPNPATDKVKVYLSNGFGEKRLEVYDMTGKLCKVHTMDEGWAQSDLYVSDLPSGVYVVKLIVGGKLKGTEKLIVN